MELCRLCKKQVENLCDSHIIPEFGYEKTWDKKHRAIPLTNESDFKLLIIQSGYKEKLLCPECENKFSKWETVLRQTLNDIWDGNNKKIIIKKEDDGKYISVSKIRYNEFKKAILSIFWRLSVSKSFDTYCFGLYNERLRLILLNDEYLETTKYPISIKKITLKDNYLQSIVATFDRSRSKLLYYTYSFAMFGFLFTLHLTEDKFHSELKPIAINENGTLNVIDIKVEEFILKHSALQKLQDKKVIEKMGGLKP